MILSTENKYLPKDNQIKLSSDIDTTIYDSIITSQKKDTFSHNIISEPEKKLRKTNFHGQAKFILENETNNKSIIEYLHPGFNDLFSEKFSGAIPQNSLKFQYLFNENVKNTYKLIGESLVAFSPLFDQVFAKKNTRLTADEEITKSGNTLLKAYPFILGVGDGVNTINLQMVVRSFIIPMERVDLNTKLSVFKYPEWFMNKEAIIDAVEDTIYISKEDDKINLDKINFYGSSTNKFGHDPELYGEDLSEYSYSSNLSNYNIVNFYKRHDRLKDN